MTTYWEKLSISRMDEFNKFLQNTNMTQTEAAKLLDISKGQLSHLLKHERTLNDFMFNRIGAVMKGKKPQTTGGIYGIYLKDKLIYIGRTNNFETRFKTHISCIKHTPIRDESPFHLSGIDVNLLSYKILVDCSKKFLYLHELTRLEELLTRIILPEWNTDISTLSAKHIPVEEKIDELIHLHPIHLSLLNKEINDYELPITETGELLLLEANKYTQEEINTRAKIIISHGAIRPVIGE